VEESRLYKTARLP
jgi:hypothetical protein